MNRPDLRTQSPHPGHRNYQPPTATAPSATTLATKPSAKMSGTWAADGSLRTKKPYGRAKKTHPPTCRTSPEKPRRLCKTAVGLRGVEHFPVATTRWSHRITEVLLSPLLRSRTDRRCGWGRREQREQEGPRITFVSSLRDFRARGVKVKFPLTSSNGLRAGQNHPTVQLRNVAETHSTEQRRAGQNHGYYTQRQRHPASTVIGLSDS